MQTTLAEHVHDLSQPEDRQRDADQADDHHQRIDRRPAEDRCDQPRPIANTTQMTAAPRTRLNVTGAASSDLGDHLGTGLANDVRSREMKSLFIISAYCTGSGLSSPKSRATRRSVTGRRSSGDSRSRIGAGRREEDQEDEDADREHHEERAANRRTTKRSISGALRASRAGRARLGFRRRGRSAPAP